MRVKDDLYWLGLITRPGHAYCQLPSAQRPGVLLVMDIATLVKLCNNGRVNVFVMV